MKPSKRTATRIFIIAAVLALGALPLAAQIAVTGETVYTMADDPIQNGVVLINNGKVEQVGPASAVSIPDGYRALSAKVVTPGLIDAHTVVGLAGYLNQKNDQDELERSNAIQPELRAIDAYNPRERLVGYLRGLGITTIHTGHGPGAIISGQTMITKTTGRTVEEDVIVPTAMVAATLGAGARGANNKSPGSRAKAVAMLRAELIKAQEYAHKRDHAKEGKEPPRNLRSEVLVRVLKGDLPLLVTVNRIQDILTAMRVAQEFHIKLVLDSAAEIYLELDKVKASGYPVIIHPTQYRAYGDTENISFETAAKLKQAGILFALQSGFESYVPKTRVVLFEAGEAAAHGLARRDALAAITIDAARLLGIDNRVGSIEPGKDGDVALYDGDPLELITHCTGVIIDGAVVSNTPR